MAGGRRLIRCIPSCFDFEKGEALVYTVEETTPGSFEYVRWWEPLSRWLRPDGSYCDLRVDLT